MVKCKFGKVVIKGSDKEITNDMACLLAGSSYLLKQELVDFATVLVQMAREVDLDACEQ